MSAKSFLLISPFFYPELISTGKYNTYLAKGLVKSGGKLDVLCSHSLYPNWKPEISNESLSGMEIIRGGSFMRYPFNPLIRRFFLEIWLLFFVLNYRIFSRKCYDSIIFIFPPNFVALLTPLFRSKGTEIIGIVHDIQGVMANSKKSLFRSIVMKSIHFIERFSYNSCDKLIFLSENMQKTAQALYGDFSAHTSVKYPFVTIEPYIENNSSNLNPIFLNVKQSLVYSGALGEKQAPEKLVKLFMAVLNRDLETHAFIFSQGAVFNRLKSSYQHKRLHFLPFVPEGYLPELIARSTVQVIPQVTGVSDGAFPSKLPNILAAHSKVFCITDKGGEIDILLKNYSRSMISYSWDSDVLADNLQNFLQKKSGALTSEDKNLLNKFCLSSLLEDLA